MSSWAGVQRLSQLMANRAHEELEIVRDRYPVDVYAALDAAEVRILWRATPRLLGMYLCEPGADKGVLLNRDLSQAARRHTAAHELGHDRFGHGSQLDRDVDEYLDTAPAAGWPKVEKEAETFAAWFLMPPPAVRAVLARLGLRTVGSAAHVYQLSLRLGTHYRTTARHLGNLKMIPWQQAAQWSRIPPGRLKASLENPAPPPGTRACDVWSVNAACHEEHLVVSPGDRIVIEFTTEARGGSPAWTGADSAASGVSAPSWTSTIASSGPSGTGRRVVLDTGGQSTPAVARVDVDDRVPWTFTVELRPAPKPGIDPITRATFERAARDAQHRAADGDEIDTDQGARTQISR